MPKAFEISPQFFCFAFFFCVKWEILTAFSLSSNDADSSALTCAGKEFSSSTESKEFEWNEVVESTDLVKNLEHMKWVILLPLSLQLECVRLDFFFKAQTQYRAESEFIEKSAYESLKSKLTKSLPS